MDSGFFTPKQIHGLKLRCTSEGGRDQVTDEWTSLVNEQTGSSLPTDERNRSNMIKRIVGLEGSIRALVTTRLEKKDPNWIRSRLPEFVKQRIISKETGEPDADNLSLGQCIEIIRRTDNWEDLKDIFLHERVGFENKDMVLIALSEITRVRAGMLHAKSSFLWRYGDREIVTSYIDKLTKIAEQTLVTQYNNK